MPLQGTVQVASPGVNGFDADTVLTPASAAALRAAGFEFCIRYLSLNDTPDLTAEEAEIILSAGLALMAIQHVRNDGWSPSAQLGSQSGQAAVRNANAVGFPAGVNIWLDLEGVANGTPPPNVIDYCNAWFAEVEGAGFVSGVYVGANAILNGDELYEALKTHHYWKSGSTVPEVTTRGYQLVQTIYPKNAPKSVGGVFIDTDVTQNDALGGTVLWLAPTDAPGT